MPNLPSSVMFPSRPLSAYPPVVQCELMWLDKDDLETIAVEYKAAEKTITDKVSVRKGLPALEQQ